MKMFCNQCEQTAGGTGCNQTGVCGKNPEVAGLQDILIHQIKQISVFAHQIRSMERIDREADRFVVEVLFTTVTNVNFDPERLLQTIREAASLQDRLQSMHSKICAEKGMPFDGTKPGLSVRIEPGSTTKELSSVAQEVSILSYDADPAMRSLKHLLLYGLKGMAAYAHHANLLGEEDESLYGFFHEALTEMNDALSAEKLFDLCIRCGQNNLKCMELLDKAHTSRFGHPEPTFVSTGLKKGPAIIVSGHDLPDLETLLEQTEGKGINVYTHGEMLPAHGYPGLKKYKHLSGHFGTAWQNQQKEFNAAEAAILFTTNCIQKPLDSYQDRVFTKGLVAWPGCTHILKDDFSPLIQKALSLKGFEEKTGKTLLTGCARNAVLSLAEKVIEAVRTKKIRHFFLIGGCDGAKPGRNYYTRFAELVPKDCLILTLACGKFRFNDLNFGTIDGIPRLLDVGQCNDAYSAIQIAQALAGAFHCNVNDLPLSLILSWYEQKAVVILLTLLSLGIKNIRLGPTLPAFITPDILSVLVEKYHIRPIQTPEKDLKEILG